MLRGIAYGALQNEQLAFGPVEYRPTMTDGAALSTLRRTDFGFELPGDLIAQSPPVVRGASRLLALDGATGAIQDCQFADLPDFLRSGDLLIRNNTRVLPARLHGRKPTGGAVEVLIERLQSPTRATAHVRASKGAREGHVIELPGGMTARVVGREDDLPILEFDGPLTSYLEQYGQMPLPPYISREAAESDRQRYQTVYARNAGAVAAPTAGLHFDEGLFSLCEARGVSIADVTLHVGAGTFQPVRSDDLSTHRMHAEWVDVPPATVSAVEAARNRGGRVVAIGTTVVRSLETAAGSGTLQPYEGETRIFIRPGYRFRVVDALVTNFHLPESTLIMLVSAFAGREAVLAAYAHAVRERYRFYSYGDAMWVTPVPEARGRL
jgi:S-adenosylmethionine:tRNA ribosyltransferase-isomerase